MRVLPYVWAAPATAVGLLAALVAAACGARIHRVDGTIEAGGGRLGLLVARLPRSMQFHAITFGHVILGTDEHALAACRAHERVHVRQYERWGLLFFPLYLGSSVLQVLRGRHPYRDNHFERQARALSQPR